MKFIRLQVADNNGEPITMIAGRISEKEWEEIDGILKKIDFTKTKEAK